MIALGVIMGILSVLAIGFLIFSIWLNSSYFVVTVDGGSMNDTLHSEDRLYASYSAKAKRGDIVIIDATEHPAFKPSDGSERLLIKRLIAVEGDSVKCEEGIVYLKKAGEQTYQKLEEPYLNQTTGDFKEVEVGAGQIFFLGDNRANSKDAREAGCMNFEDIIGVVPNWAVRNKGAITKWEKFRKSVADFFTVDIVHRTGG